MLDGASFWRCFECAMEALSPFERRPIIAVAVSGGGDSMALALLLDRWTRERDGGVLALSVDHQLRSESRQESEKVGLWLKRRGITHRILTWKGEIPENGIQDAARAARYDLLIKTLRQEGILHLAVAHHQDDQAETVLARLARGSGVDGLASMAASSEMGFGRIIRPLLGMSRKDLGEYCQMMEQDFINDPSNQNQKFQRVRLRNLITNESVDPARLARTASEMGRVRAALEQKTALLLAQGFSLHPSGFGQLSLQSFLSENKEIGLRALSSILRTLGGRRYPLRFEPLQNLYHSLDETGLARNLAGCLIRAKKDSILFGREARGMEAAKPIFSDCPTYWDRRYRVEIKHSATSLQIGALGEERAASIRQQIKKTDVPRIFWASQPALLRGEDLVAAPNLGYFHPDFAASLQLRVIFAPDRALAPAWRLQI